MLFVCFAPLFSLAVGSAVSAQSWLPAFAAARVVAFVAFQTWLPLASGPVLFGPAASQSQLLAVPVRFLAEFSFAVDAVASAESWHAVLASVPGLVSTLPGAPVVQAWLEAPDALASEERTSLLAVVLAASRIPAGAVASPAVPGRRRRKPKILEPRTMQMY